MINYYSPLLLPSNGLEYDPIVYLKEFSIGSIFVHYDEFYLNMEIGKIISIINNHFKHRDITNISDMYYGDVIYIWNYLCNRSFKMNEIKKKFGCEKCQQEKIITIDLKEIPIKYLESKDTAIELKIKDDFSIFYRRRKMIDNIHFTFYTLEENKQDFDYVYNYTKNQILYIKDNKKNKKLDNNLYRDFLDHIGLKKTLEIFKDIRNEDYGFNSNYIVICDKCKQKTEMKLIDPIDISFFHRGLEVSLNEYQTLMETLMTISSLKYMTFSELLEMPNSKFNLIIDAVKKLQDQKYGKENKGSYFDQVMEDM